MPQHSAPSADNLAHAVAALFTRHGDTAYDGSRQESVTALAHALQCAQLAEWAGAEAPLVAAALLHDIGHFLPGLPQDAQQHDDVDDSHEQRALPWLAASLGEPVLAPIRLHVAAKRYLVAKEPSYLAGLSPASVHSLALQGGPMDGSEQLAFEAEPYATDALLLRRWDDAAKLPGRATPPLDYYLALLAELADQHRHPGRQAISAFDAS